MFTPEPAIYCLCKNLTINSQTKSSGTACLRQAVSTPQQLSWTILDDSWLMSGQTRGRGRPPLDPLLRAAGGEGGEGAEAPSTWACPKCQKKFISLGGYQYHTRNVCRPPRKARAAGGAQRAEAGGSSDEDSSSSGADNADSAVVRETAQQRRAEFFSLEPSHIKRERRPVMRLHYAGTKAPKERPALPPPRPHPSPLRQKRRRGSGKSGRFGGSITTDSDEAEAPPSAGEGGSSTDDDGEEEEGVAARLAMNASEPSREALKAGRQQWAAAAAGSGSSSGGGVEVNLNGLTFGRSTTLSEYLEATYEQPDLVRKLQLDRVLRAADTLDPTRFVDVPGLGAHGWPSTGEVLNAGGAVLFIAFSAPFTAAGDEVFMAVGTAAIGFTAAVATGAVPRVLPVGDSCSVRASQRLSQPNLLQLWRVRRGQGIPLLAYTVALHRGPLWAGEWCSAAQASGLAGVLAVVCGDGCAVLLALPIEAAPPAAGASSIEGVPVLLEADLRKAELSLPGALITALAWQPGGDRLLCGASDASTHLFHVAAALSCPGGAAVDSPQRSFAGAPPREGGLHRAVARVSFSPDGSSVVAAGGSSRASVWSVDSGEPLGVVRAPPELRMGGLSDCVWDPCGVGLYLGSAERGLVAHCCAPGRASPLVTSNVPLLVHAVKYTAVSQLRAVRCGSQSLLLSCSLDGTLRASWPGEGGAFRQVFLVAAVDERVGSRATGVLISSAASTPSAADSFAAVLPESARRALLALDALPLGEQGASGVLVACGAACGLVRLLVLKAGGAPGLEE